MKNCLAKIIAASLVLAFTAAQAKETRYPEFGNGRIEQSLVKADSYMVAAANPYASEAGMNILEQGGSAIDGGEC